MVAKGKVDPNRVSINLGAVLEKRVSDWAINNGHHSREEAVKELICIGLSATPETGRNLYRGLKAYVEVRTMVIKHVYSFLNELWTKLESELGESNGHKEG